MSDNEVHAVLKLSLLVFADEYPPPGASQLSVPPGASPIDELVSTCTRVLNGLVMLQSEGEVSLLNVIAGDPRKDK